jgi:hypothetical protein
MPSWENRYVLERTFDFLGKQTRGCLREEM